jgi:hypothetical protein
MIKRSDFLNILKENPLDYENFISIKDKILLYDNFGDLGLKCSSCFSENHLLNDCPYIHYVANVRKILKKYQKPTNNERDEFPVSIRRKK